MQTVAQKVSLPPTRLFTPAWDGDRHLHKGPIRKGDGFEQHNLTRLDNTS